MKNLANVHCDGCEGPIKSSDIVRIRATDEIKAFCSSCYWEQDLSNISDMTKEERETCFQRYSLLAKKIDAEEKITKGSWVEVDI